MLVSVAKRAALVLALLAPPAAAQQIYNPIVNGVNLPGLATNAALASAPTTSYPKGVWRNDFANGNGAPPLFYLPSNSVCSLNAGNGDNGSQVKSADSKCWLAVWPSSGIDPRQFGATNAADSSAAINAAIATVRRSGGAGFVQLQNHINLAGAKYVITNPINLTCFSDQAATDGCGAAEYNGIFRMNANGATITCNTTGAPCLDGLGSTQVHLVGGLQIIGACDATEPSYGLQMGRTKSAINAGYWVIESLHTSGCFTKAAYYNLAGEIVTISSPQLLNNDAAVGGGSYGMIFDSTNFWNITSSFVTEAITPGTLQSFNDNTIIGGSLGAAGSVSTSNGVWLSGTNRLSFKNVFMNANNAFCVRIWNNNSTLTQFFNGEIHCESFGTAPTRIFDIVSSAAASTATLTNFRFEDYSVTATSSVFAKDANTTSILMYRENIHATLSGGSIAMFDTPSAYVLTNPDTDDFTNSSGVSSWLPTVGTNFCTGLGASGTCTFLSSNATPGRGQIALTPGGAGIAASGSVDIDWGFVMGGASIQCITDLAYAGGLWNGRATQNQVSNGRNNLRILWDNNAVALTSGQVYLISYRCAGI